MTSSDELPGDTLGALSPYEIRHLTEHLGRSGLQDQLHRLLWRRTYDPPAPSTISYENNAIGCTRKPRCRS